MPSSLIYVTASDRDEALALGRKLVEARLIACANVMDGMTSVYCWEGTVEEAAEVVLLLKTRAELVDSVVERVRELHSYDCPCVVALPIESGSEPYLQWISEMTSEEAGQ